MTCNNDGDGKYPQYESSSALIFSSKKTAHAALGLTNNRLDGKRVGWKLEVV
jgi:hypothetical protein